MIKVSCKLAGNEVSRSSFGIVISRDVGKRGSTPLSNADYRAAVTQDAKTGCQICITVYSTTTPRPNTPSTLKKPKA